MERRAGDRHDAAKRIRRHRPHDRGRIRTDRVDGGSRLPCRAWPEHHPSVRGGRLSRARDKRVVGQERERVDPGARVAKDRLDHLPVDVPAARAEILADRHQFAPLGIERETTHLELRADRRADLRAGIHIPDANHAVGRPGRKLRGAGAGDKRTQRARAGGDGSDRLPVLAVEHGDLARVQPDERTRTLPPGADAHALDDAVAKVERNRRRVERAQQHRPRRSAARKDDARGVGKKSDDSLAAACGIRNRADAPRQPPSRGVEDGKRAAI